MSRIIRQAPAKINLRLKIVGRRADGYHLLDSWFIPLALADQIIIEAQPAAQTRININCPGQPQLQNEENLVVRAARAFLAQAKMEAQIEIVVEKNIFLAAGLGGGSSDAAAMLLGLNEIFNALDASTLEKLALSLGADVPFFLRPRPCRIQGIGEIISPLPKLPEFFLVLLNPLRPLNTAAVYQAFAANQPPIWTTNNQQAADKVPTSLAELIGFIENDLQLPAIGLLPIIKDQIEGLRRTGAQAAAMTGSGPTVFGLFAELEQAQAAAATLARTTKFAIQITTILAT